MFSLYIVIVSSLYSLLTVASAKQCPDEWVYNDGSCYFFSTTQKTWYDAKRACQDQEATLAMITSGPKDDFLREIVQFSVGRRSLRRWITGDYWIDGTDSTLEGRWKWSSTGQLMFYQHFYPGEPDNKYDNEDCLSMKVSYDGRWNDDNCYNHAFYICEKVAKAEVIFSAPTTSLTTEQTPHTRTECPQNWYYFDSSCYLFSNEQLPWNNASASCRSMGGILTEADTNNEADFLKETIQSIRSKLSTRVAVNGYWLGGTDKTKEGEWLWSTSLQPVNLTSWQPGEPNNNLIFNSIEGEDCLEMYFHGPLNDEDCSQNNYFICESKVVD